MSDTMNWTPPIPGLTHVTGEPDTGKTTLALTVPGVTPGEIIFLDADIKSAVLARQLEAAGHPFGYYVDLQSRSKNEKKTKPIDFWVLIQTCLKEARSAVPHAKVLVADNWSPLFEDAIKAYALTQMGDISDLSKGQVANASTFTWPYIYNIYSQLLDDLQQMAQMVFVITHIKDKWVGQTKLPGVVEARGQRPLLERPNFRVWTRHNGDPADGGAPVGLILKRIQKIEVTPAGIRTMNVLPRRVKPLTWDTIIAYMNDPIGARPLKPYEIPTPLDLSILDGELTPDQKDAMRTARIAAEAAEGVPNLDLEGGDENAARAKEMMGNGTPPPMIASQLGLSLATVLDLLKS